MTSWRLSSTVGGVLATVFCLPSQAVEVTQQAPLLTPVQPVQPVPSALPRLPLNPQTPPDLNLPSQNPSPPQVPQIAPFSTTVVVRAFRFEGNTVFSDQELAKVTAPYLNRPLTFAELLQARVAVTSLYVKAGYESSGAYFAPEDNQGLDPNQTVFTIRVLEGKIEEIRVTGDLRLKRYVESRLRRSVIPVVNRFRLEEALRLLQRDPLVRSISVNLSSGSQPNLGVLSVQVQAQPIFTVQTEVNNRRSPTVGTLERSVRVESANLLGFGERVGVNYANTNGSNEVGVDTTIPFNARNGTVSLQFSNLTSRIIERPFDQLDINANSRIYQISVRQPVLRRATEQRFEELAFGLSAARLESETTLLGVPFPLSVGADDRGRTRVSALRFFQEYLNQSSRSVLIARSQFSVGLNLFNATTNATPPDGQFFVWRGQIGWLRQVLGDSRLLVRGDIQLAARSLVSLEQFSLGGPGSVRGYRQNALLSDSGVFGSAELQIPLIASARSRLEVVPFFDVGTTWNTGNRRLAEQSTLASLGLGLQYRLSLFGNSELNARLNYAIPLTDLGLDRKTLQEQGFDFSILFQTRF